MKKLIGAVIAAGAVAQILAPGAHATADDYFDCLKGQGVNNPNLNPNLILNLGKRAAQIREEGLSPDAIANGLVQDGVTPHLAGAIVACSPKIGAVAPAGPASGSPCNGSGCVPNLTQNAVPNGPCVPRSRYDFGVDAVGNPFVCLSIDSWSAAPPLVGVRTLGSRRSGQLSAQSPDGIAMLCMNGVWVMGDDIPR
jgi:hypothetical protein